MLEVEQKFKVTNVEALLSRLGELDFMQRSVETHIDTYLRHPARDFAISGEALRIRQVDDQFFVTYKGPRMAGLVKIRPEIELPIGGSSESWITLWGQLGFSVAERVHKWRRTMTSVKFPGVTVAVDHVDRLGDFVEIELLIEDSGDQGQAVQTIEQLAVLLELDQHEPRSYLRQIIELNSSQR